MALFITQLLAFSLAWWLGLYLLGRDIRTPQLRLTGLGLASYALGLAMSLLGRYAVDPDQARILAQWGWPLFFLPAFFWFGALIYLLPDEVGLRQRLNNYARYLPPVVLGMYLILGITGLVVEATAEDIRPGPAYWLFAAAVLFDLLGAFVLLLWAWRSERPKQYLGLILVATLFFTLGTVLLIFPLGWLPEWLLALGIGLDLVLLGLAIVTQDAFDLGEALWPDFTRSLAFSAIAAAIFGGQVALVIVFSTGLNLPMLLLLLAVIGTAVITQTLADPIQNGLDWLVFARLPRVRQERAVLRAAASAAPRLTKNNPFTDYSESQFARLTRRALSHLGDLPRLAASPLTQLPLIDHRLAKRGSAGNTLQRAAELKGLLAESIERLRPRDQGDFGQTDEWRHYNALYFPYVAGLRPYSRRASHEGLSSSDQQALAWFQQQVPERTLYNWQKAAANLVAQDLREQMVGLPDGD